MQIILEYDAPQEAQESAGSALKWISERTNWLMIYDGADGDYEIVEKFLPPGNGGNILITTRNMGLKRITLTSQRVLNMAEEEAVGLLLKSAELENGSDHDSDLARKLVSELGGIPVALDQAGAFLQTSQRGIANYLELSTKYKHEILSNPEFKGASHYDNTTFGTWDVSMQWIEKMAENDNVEKALAAQSAIKILRIFAFLDNANISEELFKITAAGDYMKSDIDEEAKSNLPLSLSLLDCQTFFLTNGVWDKMKFLGGIQVLISFSLIEAHNRLYSMNILSHAWNRHRVHQETYKETDELT
jgi:hypothetical protein